jgi:hypothetical protein
MALRRGIRNLVESPNVDLRDLLEDMRLRLDEIDRRLSETFIQRWARRTSVVLGLQNIAQSAILAALGEFAGQSVHLPPGIGPAIGIGASGVLQVAQKKVSEDLVLPERISDFYYVYAAARLWR